VATKVVMSGLRGIDEAMALSVTRPIGLSDITALGNSWFPIFRCLPGLRVWCIGLLLRCLRLWFTVVNICRSFIAASSFNPHIRSGHGATGWQI
jgi:hypothetical protein